MRVTCCFIDEAGNKTKPMTADEAKVYLGKDGIRKLMKSYLEIMLSMPGVKVEFKE